MNNEGQTIKPRRCICFKCDFNEGESNRNRSVADLFDVNLNTMPLHDNEQDIVMDFDKEESSSSDLELSDHEEEEKQSGQGSFIHSSK